MTQRDVVFLGILVFVVAGFGLIAYGFWRGRSAAAPPGWDADAYWATHTRIQAIGTVSLVALFLLTMASPDPVVAYLVVLPLWTCALVAYIWKVMRHAPTVGGDPRRAAKVHGIVMLAAVLLMTVLIPVVAHI